MKYNALVSAAGNWDVVCPLSETEQHQDGRYSIGEFSTKQEAQSAIDEYRDPVRVLCRKHDSSVFEKMTVKQWKEAEKKAGSVSAFAETVEVVNGICDNGMTESEFLEYRNN